MATASERIREAREAKTVGPCPSCGLNVIRTGDGRHPCSWCGQPLPSTTDARLAALEV